MEFWFSEYDEESFDKDFLRINYIKYLNLALSYNEGHPPSIESITLSKNRIESLLQNQLLEQLELLDNFFSEVSSINNDELMEFASLMNIFLQVERFYYVEFWSLEISQDYLINRLVASFIRYLKFFKSFHRTLFTYNKIMIVQTQSGIKSAVDRCLFCSLEEIENDVALPIDDLRAFIDYFYVSYTNIKRTFSKSSLLFEKDRVIFDKILLYVENFLTKSMDTVNQEAKVLYGDVERSLQEIILKNNKMSIKLLEEWREEMKYNENIKKNMDEEALLELTTEEIDIICGFRQKIEKMDDSSLQLMQNNSSDRRDSGSTTNSSTRKDSKNVKHKNTTLLTNKRITQNIQGVQGVNLKSKGGLGGTISNSGLHSTQMPLKSIAVNSKKTMIGDFSAFNTKSLTQKRGSSQDEKSREGKRDQYSTIVLGKVEKQELDNVYEANTYFNSPNLPSNLKDSILPYFIDVTSGGSGSPEYVRRREEEYMRGFSRNLNESSNLESKKRDVKDLLEEKLNEDLINFIKVTGQEITNVQENEIKKEEREDNSINKDLKDGKKKPGKSARFRDGTGENNNTTLGNSQKTEENETRVSTTLDAEKLEKEKAEKRKERNRKKGKNKDELKNRRVNQQQFIKIDANFEIKEKLIYIPCDEDEPKDGLDQEIFEYNIMHEEHDDQDNYENKANNFNTMVEFVEVMKVRESMLLAKIRNIPRWNMVRNTIRCDGLEKYITNKYMDDKINLDAKKREMNFKSKNKKICSNFFGNVDFKSF